MDSFKLNSKWFPLITSLICMVFSIVMVIISSFVLVYMSNFCELPYEDNKSEVTLCYVPLVFNIIGAFIIISIIIGYLEFVWKNYRIVFAYGLLLSVLVVLLIGTSIAVFGLSKVKVLRLVEFGKQYQFYQWYFVTKIVLTYCEKTLF